MVLSPAIKVWLLGHVLDEVERHQLVASPQCMAWTLMERLQSGVALSERRRAGEGVLVSFRLAACKLKPCCALGRRSRGPNPHNSHLNSIQREDGDIIIIFNIILDCPTTFESLEIECYVET